MDNTTILILIILICVLCILINNLQYIPILIGGSIIGAEENRNQQIEQLRKNYSINDIKKMIKPDMKTGQYIISPNTYNLQFASSRINPPYPGLILILRVKKIHSELLADIMMSLSIREYAYIVLINETSQEISVYGVTRLLEDISLGKSREFLVTYLNQLPNLNIFQTTDPNIAFEKSKNHVNLKWETMIGMTEQDIRNLDWSEFLDKIDVVCHKSKYEVGGSADIINGKVKIMSINDGNIGSVTVNNDGNMIVFHSHPASNKFAEMPSCSDLYSAFKGYKSGTVAWDVVIAQEGLYVYRPIEAIMDDEKSLKQRLSNLNISCYRLKSVQCINTVMNRIRNVGFIIYFIPNKKYFDNLGEDYAMNYWNFIDNTVFIKQMEKVAKFTSKDFENLDWTEVKNVISISNTDNIIVANIVNGKVVVAGGAGCRFVDVQKPIGVIPGRYGALLDIFTQKNKITKFELEHINNSIGYIAWCIFILPNEYVAIRTNQIHDVKNAEYTVEEIIGMGYEVIRFVKI